MLNYLKGADMSILFKSKQSGLFVLFMLMIQLSFSCPDGWSGTISGSVTAMDGTTPFDRAVSIVLHQGDPCQNYTDISAVDINPVTGAFTIENVPAGQYYLKLHNTAGQINTVENWWDTTGGSVDCYDAELVTITEEQNLLDMNFKTQTGGSVSGTVYESDGTTPIEGMTVYIMDDACWGTLHPPVNTDASGNYTFNGIPPGTVKIAVCPECNNQNYMPQWYGGDNGAGSCSLSSGAEVTKEAVTSGIDFALDAGGIISGTVYESDGATPIEGVKVTAHLNACGGSRYGEATTDAAGAYIMQGLPAGTFKVRACPECDNLDYLNEWYDGSDGTFDCSQAADVPVVMGQATSGIDLQVDVGGRITGRVTDTAGNGLADVTVSSYGGLCSNNLFKGVKTDSNGNYLISGIPHDSDLYLFANADANPDPMAYKNEWYDNILAGDCDSAAPVHVNAGQTAAGTDFQLDYHIPFELHYIHEANGSFATPWSKNSLPAVMRYL